MLRGYFIPFLILDQVLYLLIAFMPNGAIRIIFRGFLHKSYIELITRDRRMIEYWYNTHCAIANTDFVNDFRRIRELP